MTRISFTKFLDFIAQTGEPKAETAISAWRQSNTPYDPRRDYHRRVRSALVDAQRRGITPEWQEFIESQNEKKRSNYKDTIEKFEDWKSDYSDFGWFDPPRSEWASTEFRVTVNPELGLALDGEVYAIKLFLNRNRLSRLKAQAGGLIMHQALAEDCPGAKFAIFDVKAEAFHVFQGSNEALDYLLIGEAAHMSAIIGAVRAA